MKRQIVTPAALPPAALAELKQWLGITTALDDAPLAVLLRAGITMCEAFTGTMPIACTCEEVLPLGGGWQALATRPILSIGDVFGVAADGTRFALPVDTYAIELDADGGGRVRVTEPGEAVRIAVRFTAGLAETWETLPDALRHGVVRLAAHQHRERETSGAGPIPPAAITALWRPWRRMRVA
jgi:uncharacterized phiE125 gp8 family phage protein